jgi:hypothetical protein
MVDGTIERALQSPTAKEADSTHGKKEKREESRPGT